MAPRARALSPPLPFSLRDLTPHLLQLQSFPNETKYNRINLLNRMRLMKLHTPTERKGKLLNL
jgi:hypothetical protein